MEKEITQKHADLDRKDSHIRICLEDGVEFSTFDGNGFGSYRFDHDALPEIKKSEIDLSTTIFGRKLRAPIIIGSMTGGTERARGINQRLARAAEKCGVGLALGSQRKMIESSGLSTSYAMKEVAPKLPLLIGNLGAVQLNYGVTVQQILKLIEETSCDAFVFHLNPLQEAIQPEGDTDFSGLLSKLKAVISKIKIPVFVKEVGSGISETTALKLKDLGLAGVEVAGTGGTSWSKIESLRTENSIQKKTGELFSRWGIPSAESVITCRRILLNHTIIASGGIRNGIEAAKAICLGADAVATALPMLRAAEESESAVVEAIELFIEELRTTLFVTGSSNLRDLKTKKLRKAVDFTAS